MLTDLVEVIEFVANCNIAAIYLLKANTSTRTILVTICSEGYFEVYFLFEDYFGDLFLIWQLFSGKIVF